MPNLKKNHGINIFNLGTGKGFTVMELIKTFEDVTKQKIPKKIISRREGDVSSCFADPTKSNEWKSLFSIKSFSFFSSNDSKALFT